MQKIIMKTKLISQGNSWGFYLNKTWAQLMGITPDNYTVVLYIEKQTLFVAHCSNEKFSNHNIITKKLIKRGSGYTITLTLPILQLLELNPADESVEINLENNILTIEKADKQKLQHQLTTLNLH